MGWQWAVALFAAFILTGVSSLWQMRRYTAQINAMARQFRAPGRQLVSGRHKGRLRGVIVALVVDPGRDEIVAAGAMTGVSVFARLRPAPALTGPLSSVIDRTDDKGTRRAVEDALGRVRDGGQQPSRTPASAPPARTVVRRRAVAG